MNRREFVRAAIALPIAAQLPVPELEPIEKALWEIVPVTQEMLGPDVLYVTQLIRRQLMESIILTQDREFMSEFMHGHGVSF